MGLSIETTGRIERYWQDWAQPTAESVSIVDIGSERYTCAPERLLPMLEIERPRDLEGLLTLLGA